MARLGTPSVMDLVGRGSHAPIELQVIQTIKHVLLCLGQSITVAISATVASVAVLFTHHLFFFCACRFCRTATLCRRRRTTPLALHSPKQRIKVGQHLSIL